MSEPLVQLIPGPATVQDLSGTVAHMGDFAAVRATGGVALQDDQNWLAGVAGPRELNSGAWDTFPTGAGGVQLIDDPTIGLGLARCNNPAGTAGMRSRKAFQMPTKISSTTVLSCAMPWRYVYLEMLLRYGSLFNVTQDNYFFGWHSNFVATDFAGGRCIAFVVNNGPATISAVIRDAAETRFALSISTDDDWHRYEILAPCVASPSTDPPGPTFYVDGVLVATVPSGHANLPRGPMYVKIGHYNETNASISNAWTQAGYVGRKKGLRP